MRERIVEARTGDQRFRFQFRLTTLFICITLFCTTLGLWIAWTGPVQEEQRAIARLRALHAGVVTETVDSVWLQRVMGGERVLRAEWVSHRGPHVTDRDATLVKKLRSLKALIIGGKQFTDAGLSQLRGLESLEELLIIRSRITDDGLKWIGELHGLRDLSLYNNQTITDRGIAHLKDLENLEVVSLLGTQVSDGGLRHLLGMKKLCVLDVMGTNVTGDGLDRLKDRFPELDVRR